MVNLRDRSLPVAVATCAVGAALLRWAHLKDQPLWYDEIAGLYRSSAPDLPSLVSRLAADVQAPLHDLIMVPLIAAFGDGSLVARLPALVASVLLVPLVATLARELGGGRGAQLAAAAWVAVDPYLVRYGVEGRPYALLALLSGGLVLAALRCVRRDGRGAWALGAWGAPLAMVHPYGVPVLVAVGLWLLGNGSRLRSAAGSVLGALLMPILALLAWSPLALHQLGTKSMSAIYSGLTWEQVLTTFDAVTLAAPRATGAHSGDALVVAGRVGTLLLLVLGCWTAGRGLRREPGMLVAPPRPRAVLCLTGLAAALALTLAFAVPFDTLADSLSRLAKGGRALDPQNLETLGTLRRFAGLAGLGLASLAALAWWLPSLATRWRGQASPHVLALLVMGVPLLFVVALDATGRPTFAPRNAIGVVPVAVALAAVGLASLPARIMAPLMLLLAVQAGWGLGAIEDFHKRRAWPEIVVALEVSGAEPLAHPPWLGRCLEYHGRRPWGSVYGTRRPQEAADWAAAQGHVALVTGYEALADPAAVREAVEAVLTPGEVVRARGLTLQRFGGP
jgi:hypothetical protein